MVFIGVGRQRREDRWINRRHLRREQRLVAEVHQRFVGVVAQESANVVELSERAAIFSMRRNPAACSGNYEFGGTVHEGIFAKIYAAES